MRRFASAASVFGLMLWGVASSAVAAVPGAAGPSALAVAPFSPPPASAAPVDAPAVSDFPDVATLLAGELARKSPARVVGPSALRGRVADPGSPKASEVRQWASQNSVDRVVIGRMSRHPAGGVEVQVELRSGHSGAAEADYRLEAESEPALSAAVGELAVLILADASEAEVVESAAPAGIGAGEGDALPPVGTPRAPKAGSEGKDDRMALLPGERSDDPISIKSDELEVLPQDGGRRLVFSRNVVVVQGDVQLRANRLEAIYPQGASQPASLRATGSVFVDQGERKARCQEATYVRASETIVCRGKAEVLQGCDLVRGREIEFDLANDRMRVSGAASVWIQGDAVPGDCPRSGS